MCAQICVACRASSLTRHANICPSGALWCTHAPLNKFFYLVMCNVPDTATNRSCSLILRGTGKSKPQVTLSLKKCDDIHRFFLSFWLLAPFLWYSIPPNLQKIIKFQVSYHLLLWRSSLMMFQFIYPVGQVMMHRQLLYSCWVFFFKPFEHVLKQ